MCAFFYLTVSVLRFHVTINVYFFVTCSMLTVTDIKCNLKVDRSFIRSRNEVQQFSHFLGPSISQSLIKTDVR